MRQTSDPLPSISEQQEVTIPLTPNLPRLDLLTGPRADYLKIGVPLYEASIKCDWKAAKVILDKQRELVRYSITENGETALHVAASAKGRPKQVNEFVQNLVGLMEIDDLTLQNKSFNTAFYLAAAAGNLKTVSIMLEKNRSLLTIAGARGDMLPLYTAALFGNNDVVKYLFDNSSLRDKAWTHENRGFLLETCVENNMFDVAIKILKEHPELAGSGPVLEGLARKPDVFTETKSNMIRRTINSVFDFICSKAVVPEVESDALKLLRIVWEDVAKKPRREIDKILRGPEDDVDEYKKPVSGKAYQALELQKLVAEHIVNMHVQTQNIMKKDATPDSGKDDQTVQLEKVISDNISNMQVQTRNIIHGPTTKKTYSSRILFIASEMGNTKFVVELIRKYPDLIWKVNDNNQSIFHIAVKHRHEGIYNLLYEIGAMKDLITPLKDNENNNNMLHLVGMRAKQERLEDVSGVAFQVQRELLWFHEVQAMIPPSYREKKNKEGLTPHELFTKEHKDLVTLGEKWMKETANQCMVVSALIATIVFAAAFTVPGGYDQNNGIPIFRSKATLVVFVVADAISLFSSSASILMFLSILTSRYAERDFLESLPKKLLLGLATLFLSITTMTVAFSVSFFVLYQTGLLWIPILIGVFAVMPVLLYIFLQYALFFDIIRSTYGSRYLFKPKEHVLYYENPKV